MQTTSSTDVVVVGSLNLDLVTTTLRLPLTGETLLGQSFGTFVGGKGFNQAVAASRTGSRVGMIGKLGQDSFGNTLANALQQEGIGASYVTRCADPQISTGVATIIVDTGGNNSIVVVPGANFQLNGVDVTEAAPLIQQTKVLLLQLEVPLPICQQAAKLAHEAGVKVILTPAPVPNEPLPLALLSSLDLLVLNEIEVQQLAQLYQKSLPTELDEVEAARQLLAATQKVGANLQAVVVTLGERGSVWVTAEQNYFVTGFTVAAVDTTAAGDTFTGALATALSQSLAIPAALRFANAAGALAVTRKGAAPSIPTAAEISSFMQQA